MSRFAWRPVAAITLATVAVLAVTVDRYGPHRDELYFWVLSRHPAFGYVDQPPLTPMLIRLSTGVFGDHLWAIRLPAVVLGPLAIPVFALLTREFGGTRGAQVLSAAGGFCAFVLVGGHVLVTATVDITFSGLVLLLVVKALRDDPRYWVGAGAVLGLSLYNKQLIPLLLLGVGVGLLVAGPRRALRSPWLYLGIVVAAVVALPNVLYQLRNGLPQLDMASALSREAAENDRRQLFFPMQVLLIGLTLAPVSVAGFVSLLRDPRLRSLAWGYLAVAAFVFATGTGYYYTFGFLMTFYAAGCVVAARWAAGRRGRWTWLVLAAVLSEAVGVLVALPVVPVDVVRDTPIGLLNHTARDQVGWPAYVREISAVRPPGAPIIANNYGEYGALVYYGVTGVYSGHNQLRYFGSPPEGTTEVVAVGFDDPAVLNRSFASCAEKGRLDSGTGVDNEEQGRVIYVCQGPIAPWPAFYHYG